MFSSLPSVIITLPLDLPTTFIYVSHAINKRLNRTIFAFLTVVCPMPLGQPTLFIFGGKLIALRVMPSVAG